ASAPRTTHRSALAADGCAERGLYPADDTPLDIPRAGCAERGLYPADDTPLSARRRRMCRARHERPRPHPTVLSLNGMYGASAGKPHVKSATTTAAAS